MSNKIVPAGMIHISGLAVGSKMINKLRGFLASESTGNKNLRIIFVLLLVSLIYIFFSIKIKGDIFVQTAYSYYTFLLTALFHGKLNIVSRQILICPFLTVSNI